MPEINQDLFFREVSLRIGSTLEIEHALASTAKYLVGFFPLDVLSLHYYDPGREAVYSTASYSVDKGPMRFDESEPLLTMDEETIGRLRKEGASVDENHHVRIFNRPRTDAIYKSCERFYRKLGLNAFSYLMLRLEIGVDYQGVLLVAARDHGCFSEKHAQLLEIIEEPVALAMSNARHYLTAVGLKDQLIEDNRAMNREMATISGNQVVGADLGLRKTMQLVRQVSPMNAPVLLQGETGTGKEVIANAIHMASPRREGPLVRVQCGAIPDTLLDSELFGHEKGAFTGAVQARRGRFERADGGTIFFDEIGELTLDAQVKLLRVLQEHEFERLGDSRTITVDVRVIAATNRRLQDSVFRKEFREDLWFRLNVFPILLPPLRQRKEDIPALVQWLLERKSREMGLPSQPPLAPGAMEQLLAYDWPGNVRELLNILERALILSQDGPLAFAPLGEQQWTEAQFVATDSTDEFVPLERAVDQHIRRALSISGGRVQGSSGAATLLGVNPSTLRARMRKLGIPFGLRGQ